MAEPAAGSGGPPRRIILLSDGTGNSAASFFPTNIRRIYEALDLADPPQPRQPRQFAFYDDGVGTSGFRPLALLGAAFGYGLARNVRELYAFLCRTYRPGDEIHAFGFSRGAFTVRLLAGLILHEGIVRYDGDEAALQRKVRAAFRTYRKARYRGRPLAMLLHAVKTAWDRLWSRLTGAEGQYYRPAENIGGPGAPEAEKPRITFLGCFDTVDAYGLPFDELTRAWDALVFPLTLPDANLHPRVLRACQALSLDDRRETFFPRLWNEAGEAKAGTPGERITQVWFAGMHADVGGGYPDDALAHVALGWMVQQAARTGLRFKEPVLERQRSRADENGPMHDSRRGLGSYYRYRPRNLNALARQDRFTSGGTDIVIHRHRVHESVFRRSADGTQGYVPINLPDRFEVVRRGGGREEGSACLGVGAAGMQALAERREWAWNWVWWRRLAYFWTLLATLALLGAPFALTNRSCSSWACFIAPLIEAAGLALPAFAAPWIETYAANPASFATLVLAILLGLGAGSWLDTRIDDTMRQGWYALVPGAPVPAGGGPAARPPGRLNRAVQRLRHAAGYLALAHAAKRFGLPAAAALLAGWLALGLLNAASLAAYASLGGLCPASNGSRPVEAGAPRLLHFDTRATCAATGLWLEEGATYRIRLHVPPDPQAPGAPPWRDGSLPAWPNGIRAADQPWTMAAFIPFRAALRQPWFRLLARVGRRVARISTRRNGACSPVRQRGTCTRPSSPRGAPARSISSSTMRCCCWG